MDTSPWSVDGGPDRVVLRRVAYFAVNTRRHLRHGARLLCYTHTGNREDVEPISINLRRDMT
jgi:hypothetical protein